MNKCEALEQVDCPDIKIRMSSITKHNEIDATNPWGYSVNQPFKYKID